MDAKGNQRCLPVFLGDNASSDIPAIFNGYTRFQITALSLDDSQSSYANLYRLLTRQSTAQKAELGALHKLSALPPRKRLTDFTDLIDQILAGIGEILAILKKGQSPQSTPERPHNLPPWMPPERFTGRDKEVRA